MPPLKQESHSSPREVKENKSINKQNVSNVRMLQLAYNETHKVRPKSF
jgi:hypothetical protein